ncbi:endonuclease/exonuclease/phosphatase family protein, partial [Kineococcus sp. SYSU DK006]|uniref:endonuclease/exonuclease/phosphatase family protein n=1 Tax=Kineococcus sp. SYSU DK006 TaxID=3383127 RepID=UPI003D7E14DB
MSTPAPSTPGTADAPLRVMTWNVWWRFGDWRARREALLAVLAEHAPDVVGLQEVWADGDENLAHWLGERLGMHVAWSPSPAPQRWQRRLLSTGEAAGAEELQFGNAVLSRYPLLEERVRRLPAGGHEDEGRTALQVLVDAPRRPLPFTTTHLNSSPAESAVRVAQVRELVGFVAERHRPREFYPPVLTGDFNAVAESDELRLAGGYLTAGPVPGLVLVDSWHYAEPGDSGLTWDRANPWVARVHQPSARIDHVLVGLPPFSGEGAGRPARRVAPAPLDRGWASDQTAGRVDHNPRPAAGPA